VNVTPLDISPYMAKLPQARTKPEVAAGKHHTLTPTSKGKVPKFQWTQFTPPQAKIQNLNPKLAMDPSLLGPPDLKVASPNMANFGDPWPRTSLILSEMAMAPVLAAAPVEPWSRRRRRHGRRNVPRGPERRRFADVHLLSATGVLRRSS